MFIVKAFARISNETYSFFLLNKLLFSEINICVTLKWGSGKKWTSKRKKYPQKKHFKRKKEIASIKYTIFLCVLICFLVDDGYTK